MTQYLLDSGDPEEYRQITSEAHEKGEVIFGATTNPSLIAKKLSGKKVSQREAFDLQKQIVTEILDIVPGPVSAEVYADQQTTADQMIEQGREIATWDERIVVKLPTTIEGFKARTALRRSSIPTNNTLIFSQQQIFAVCLHEKIIKKGKSLEDRWPPFISPFVGRLDDKNEDGMMLIEQAMTMKRTYDFTPLILLSSVRRNEHMKRGLDCEVDLITAPINVYTNWFSMTYEQKNGLDATSYAQSLNKIAKWNPPQELMSIDSTEMFQSAIERNILNIHHELTDSGVTRFAKDWNEILL